MKALRLVADWDPRPGIFATLGPAGMAEAGIPPERIVPAGS
jgi:hypothetical protein